MEIAFARHINDERLEFMTKLSRNAPCPCGSGKKYKKCCLAQDEAIKRATMQILPKASSPKIMSVFDDVNNQDALYLDALSNSALDLIESGNIEEAESVCRELTERYPDLPDGAMRFAEVHKARGEYAQAAEQLLRAVEIIRADESGYDPEFTQLLLNEAEELQLLHKKI